MIFNKQNCDNCVHLFINNGINGVNKVYELLTSFITKYEINNNLDEYRSDTKMIFTVFQDTFGSELTKNEILTCMDKDDIDDQNEYENHMTVLGNIQYVLDHIDNVDLYNPDKDFNLNCAYVFSYFNKKKNELNELIDTMNGATKVLSSLKTTLEHMNVNMTEINTAIIDTDE
tara:strand:- start:437 stop:955 length:519 start_codon:yes stop_codon:yes gene_type:complete